MMLLKKVYIIYHISEHMFLRKECITIMNKRQDIINRIEKLTDKQFELLIHLFSQQEQESARVSQFEHPSFSQSFE